MERTLYSARLERKTCISESAQCFHFDFVIDELESFPFIAGQFVSTVADDPNGKHQTRAYSIASAAKANRFDLCVNRVEGGFFSNHLADLTDLPPGGSVKVHGPHGHFVLRPAITDSIFIATGTGIAPFRAMAPGYLSHPHARQLTLLFGVRHERTIYYRDDFDALAGTYPNFRFWPTLSRTESSWAGRTGHVQAHLLEAIGDRRDLDVYICGLKAMVDDVRAILKGLGFDRKQIIFEKYD